MRHSIAEVGLLEVSLRRKLKAKGWTHCRIRPGILSPAALAWLAENVGPRMDTWEFPYQGSLWFSDPQAALMFKLKFG